MADRTDALPWSAATRREEGVMTSAVTPAENDPLFGEPLVMRDLLYRGMERIGALYDRGEDLIGVPTGYLDLDQRMSGLRRGTLTLVAGRPAMGKTSFVLGMAVHAALKGGHPVLLCTPEMEPGGVFQRLLSAEAKVDSVRLRNGRLLESDWPRITEAVTRLKDAPLYVDEGGSNSIAALRQKVSALKATLGTLGVVVVDDMWLITEPSPEPRLVHPGETCRALKTIAFDLDIPVVAVSRISRRVERRHDHRPMLHDLSGAGEEDADVVVLLYRDEVYNPHTSDAGLAEVIVAKNRGGPTGLSRLVFNDRFMRFDNVAGHAS